MLMIETCDDGVFCGALRDVRYLISKACHQYTPLEAGIVQPGAVFFCSF